MDPISRAELAHHVPPKIDRTFAGDADSKKDGKQFRVEQGLRTALDQALAESLVFESSR